MRDGALIGSTRPRVRLMVKAELGRKSWQAAVKALVEKRVSVNLGLCPFHRKESYASRLRSAILPPRPHV